MCTYDYTPYRGCAKGQQHFYLQWMKCNKALENGNRHCPLHESVEVEELKKLSGNVLFCPLDNPISVQQHEFLFLAGDDQDDHPQKPMQTEEFRARSRSARSIRGRPTTLYSTDRSPENSFGERVRRTARKKAPRDLSPPSPASDCSDSPIPRPKTASGVKRLDDHKVLENHKTLARTRSHRRASSVEWAPLPTVKVTRPRPSDDDHKARPSRSDSVPKVEEEVPKQPIGPGPLSPGMRARLGLPASPDMHRRNSLIQRSRSESPMKAEFQFPVDGPATDPEFGHPLFTQDSSPEQRPEPFSGQPPVRRARTTRTRSRTSEESMMRRIVEDRRAEEESTTRLMPTPKRDVKMTFPDHEHQPDQAVGLGLGQMQTDGKRLTRAKRRIARSKSPDLTVDVPLPQRRRQYVREEPSSSNLVAFASQTASPEPPAADNQFSYVNTSIRASRTAPDTDEDDAARVLQQKREARKSRRYEEQVAEAKKWAAARDQHFSESVPNLPAAYDKSYLPPHQSPPEPSWLGGPRQSNDSGYLSQSHSGQQQGKPQLPQRRNTLHKSQHKAQISGTSTATTVSMAQSESTSEMDAGNMKEYQQLAMRQPLTVKQEVVHVTALPPPAGHPDDGSGQVVGKASLLKRMGLKRKISSLWERNGGVNGAAAVAG
ncbi:hypothetical protein V8F33_010865 [Rhypophila sp. PSN 637]